MGFSSHQSTEIVGIVNVVPSVVEDNMDLALLTQEERKALVNHTGIHYRRVANKQADICDFFEKAIVELLQQTGWEKDAVHALICVTQAPEMLIPSVSNRIHGNLDFETHTLAFDVNSGCSGFVYGLNVAYSLLASMAGEKNRAILCCGDLSTHLIDANDTSVRPIFSDGVSAIAIEKNASNDGLSAYFNLETIGKGQNAIAMPPGEKMRLNGIDVYGFSIKYVPSNVTNLLHFANKTIDFPDGFVLHQANKLINESIRKKLDVIPEKWPYSLEKYGNTASASIPITLAQNNLLNRSGWIALVGFGVGFSVASALIRYRPRFCQTIEFL